MSQALEWLPFPSRVVGTISPAERRRTRRVNLNIPARVRTCQPHGGLPEEERLTARNLSRDGIYFVTRHSEYRCNMHLYVACPAGNSLSRGEEESARVVRVQSLGDKGWGVAVAFLRSANSFHGVESPSRR